MTEINQDVLEAHKHSIAHRHIMSEEETCGCFYCLNIFKKSEVEEWWPDKNGETAVCPKCGIDAVIGTSSGYPVTSEFLKQMREYWFYP